MTDVKDLICAAVSLAGMEETRVYLASGRSLAQLTDAQLCERWLAVMRELAEDPTSGTLWRSESNVRYEAEIRKAPLSDEFMKEALDKVLGRVQVCMSDVFNDPIKRLSLEHNLLALLVNVSEQLATSIKN